MDYGSYLYLEEVPDGIPPRTQVDSNTVGRNMVLRVGDYLYVVMVGFVVRIVKTVIHV